MTRVVAAIDNSGAARSVLGVGQAVALALGADLEAVHVVEDGHETASASAAAAGLSLRTLSGIPAEALTREADRADVLAVVFGLRDRTAGPRPAGHLVLEVASRTHTPVVAVPPDTVAPDRVSTLLVAMEGSTASSEALRRTLSLSAGAGLDLVVVHVDEEVPPFTDQVQHESDAYLQEFVARHGPGLRDVRITRCWRPSTWSAPISWRWGGPTRGVPTAGRWPARSWRTARYPSCSSRCLDALDVADPRLRVSVVHRTTPALTEEWTCQH
jgi:nucleotide-binding universal stress UspA family protein